jgi:hypothetical protein
VEFWIINADTIVGGTAWVLPDLPSGYYWLSGTSNDGRDHDWVLKLMRY